MKKIQQIRFHILLTMMISSIVMMLSVGCAPPEAKKSSTGIIGKKTNKIGEFDPAANREIKVEDGSDVNIVTGAMGALGPAADQIAKLRIEQELNLYRAEFGDYPKTYDEFMEKIIIAKNVMLPEPRTNLEYQYDVANHKLVMVKKQNAAEEE